MNKDNLITWAILAILIAIMMVIQWMQGENVERGIHDIQANQAVILAYQGTALAMYCETANLLMPGFEDQWGRNCDSLMEHETILTDFPY